MASGFQKIENQMPLWNWLTYGTAGPMANIIDRTVWGQYRRFCSGYGALNVFCPQRVCWELLAFCHGISDLWRAPLDLRDLSPLWFVEGLNYLEYPWSLK